MHCLALHVRVGHCLRLATVVAIAANAGCGGSPAPGLDAPRDSAGGERSADGGSGCPALLAPVTTGTVASAEVAEASGLAASSKNPGVLWTHNDSGDTARVFALDATGKLLGTYTLSGVVATDWEDLAIGPGPVAGESYLYLGDIGDNGLVRANVLVQRVVEPALSLTQAPVTASIGPVEAITLTYPDGAHNAEALLVDPSGGDLFVVTKSDDGVSKVFRSAAPQPTAPRVLAEVATITLGAGSGAIGAARNKLFTGGDISRDGSWILLRTYFDVFLWRRPAGSAVGAVLGGEPCEGQVPIEPQGEAIAADPVSGGYYTLSEKANPFIYLVKRQ